MNSELRIITTINPEIESLGKIIVDSCFAVHQEMGPGLLESVYEECLAKELKHRNIPFELQKIFPLSYKGEMLSNIYKADLIVDNKIIVEIKSIERMDENLCKAQLLSYLKLSGLRLGFIVNFNSKLIKEGLKRVVL
ncbi:MAG: GxxExxY protein [Alphaproteobacteria bacterium PRO2]|nr:GxxExxY protein [Alphaproteobacteria bacterium PRO2]